MQENDIKNVITFLETEFWLHSTYPTLDETAQKTGFSKVQIKIQQPKINVVLKSRGLPPVEFSRSEISDDTPKVEIPRLTKDELIDPDFATAVNYIVDTYDTRSQAAKLKAANLTSRQFKAMMKKKANQDYFAKRIQQTFEATDNDMKLSLSKLVMNGDLGAIKYYNELVGTYRPNQETLINLGILISKIMEVLARHVEPKVLEAVADEVEVAIAHEQIKALAS